MKTLLQSLSEGETQIAEVPWPAVERGALLIRSERTLVSLGTERMLLDFARAGWVEKARQQPDKVKQVLQKVRTDGLLPTIEAVRSKLDRPLRLGYCNAGTVLAVGSDVGGFKPGDRVLSNGPHAEVVSIPKNLCAKIPDNVGWDEAPFAVLGAIALQGIRLANPTLGECVTVTGLGLIGLLCVQLLRAQGCRVLGVDYDSTKCELARQFGAESVDLSKGEDPVAAGWAFSENRGMDAVIITAATQSSEPVHQGALMSRKRGRIVLVGVTGLQLARSDFYEKELTFQVSCSYGPGRYDESYEALGHDYPVGYVRWTEQRNFAAILQLMADGKLDVKTLISHRFPFDQALTAYDGASLGKALGVVLEYGSGPAVAISDQVPPGVRSLRLSSAAVTAEAAVVGVIGAGNFSGQVLLPALHATGARLKILASASGVSGAHFGRKFGFESTTTSVDEIFSEASVNTVIIATRHSSHARFVLRGLEAGKRVYVEKPLCIHPEELVEIEKACHQKSGTAFLMVGFNRRFSPHVARIKQLLDGVREPKALVVTVNAGALPLSHWTQDPQEGGGRIVGEACHFVDLVRYLAGHPIVGTSATPMRSVGSSANPDTLSFNMTFADGSVGTVHYLANGHRGFPKERLEVFCGGRVLQLDNFRRLTGYGWPGFRRMNLWRQDKGHRQEMTALVEAVREGKPAPIPLPELFEVTQACFEIAAAAIR